MEKKTPLELYDLTEQLLNKQLPERVKSRAELTTDDKHAALELIYEHKEILNYLRYFMDAMRIAIVKFSHPRYHGKYQEEVAGYHAKVDFVQRLLDHAAMTWKTRDQRRAKKGK